MFTAYREERPIAASLIGLQSAGTDTGATENTAYGRYWGALERVDCLHFEACYYQPLQWCIEQGFQQFEGGAQGEHKMARALLPVDTHSAHWLAHPAFAEAVDDFLQRRGRRDGQLPERIEDAQPISPRRRG
jgi:predicted N-acyltransferase